MHLCRLLENNDYELDITTVFMKVIELGEVTSQKVLQIVHALWKSKRANPRYGQRPAPKEMDIIKYHILKIFNKEAEFSDQSIT